MSTISARRLAANRANARKSTGPRTAAGKARSARNARRHGLTLPVLDDPALSSEAEALARAIAGPKADAERHAAAGRIAEAQIDLVRVRRARRQLMAELQRHIAQELFSADEKAHALIRRLAALERYEASAWSRRKMAIRAFDAIGLPPPSRRDSRRTKPISDSALLRMAGWRNPLAEYLRGYPGLYRAMTQNYRSEERSRDCNAGQGPSGHRRSARTNPAAERAAAQTNPGSKCGGSATPLAQGLLRGPVHVHVHARESLGCPFSAPSRSPSRETMDPPARGPPRFTTSARAKPTHNSARAFN
jgi:hypothetical protein